MRLMSSTDYALRILMYLAEDPARQVRAEDMATALHISHNHVQKIVQALAGGKFVRTTRGAKGGVALNKMPDQISAGAVVRWFESRQPMVECCQADGGHCVLLSKCRLKNVLAEAQETFFRHLDPFTIADCVTKKKPG